jgi:hypothetical protein
MDEVLIAPWRADIVPDEAVDFIVVAKRSCVEGTSRFKSAR